MPAIHEAAEDGDLTQLNQRLEEDPRRLNEQNGHGSSPLMQAAYHGQDAVVARLLALGADVGLRDTDGDTATHLACYDNRASVLALLVDAGAPLNARDRWGSTPLMEAAVHGAVDCVAVLLTRARQASLELDATNDMGCTAVHYAARNRRLQILRLLLDAGAHPAIRDEDGLTPLDYIQHQIGNPCIPLLQAALAEPQRPRLLLKARALADAASDIRIARDNAQSQGDPAAQQQAAAVATAPAYLKPRVQRGREMPAVEVNAQDEDDEEELGACLRFVLGLEGHGGWAGAEDERATMRAQGLFREVFVELAELLVPAWDRASV